MANRRQLVKRRSTVRNIRKITRTMQLIATARFQQALNRATATKPYAEKLANMVEAASRSSAHIEHPLLKTNESDRSALVVLSSNRGLCGGYNGNVLRAAMVEIKRRRAAGEMVDIHAMGKKAIAYFTFLGVDMASTNTKIDDRPRFDQVSALADRMIQAYVSGEVASVHVCYMRFISTGIQRPTIMRLLPIAAEESEDDQAGHPHAHAVTEIDYDFYPEPENLLGELLPASVRMRLFQCFTEAAASEQVARMVAMKAATDAAGDMIKILTQQYNRARQTAITMELLDIIGGVAAIS